MKKLFVAFYEHNEAVNQHLMLRVIFVSLFIPRSFLNGNWWLLNFVVYKPIPRQVQVLEHAVAFEGFNQVYVAFGFYKIPGQIEIHKMRTFFQEQSDIEHRCV